MSERVTAFLGDRRIASGAKEAVTRLVEEKWPDAQSEILAFDYESGKPVDLDWWDGLGRAPQRARGRPRLGVAAREVTLLPRHWDWLAEQPGGASAALRRLVDEARARGRSPRQRQDAVYRFMQATCGDRPGYEEALRALYRGDAKAFDALIAPWPEDIRGYIRELAGDGAEGGA